MSEASFKNSALARPLDGEVDLQGHRGARGRRPENTIPAFRYCIDQGMTTIELDTNVTKDDQLIVCHDTMLNGSICRDERGNAAPPIPIGDLTVAELKLYDCGSVRNPAFPEQVPVPGTSMPTLPEAFAFAKNYESGRELARPMRFNIETKFARDCTAKDIERSARLVVAAIVDAGMAERATVQSFVLPVLPIVKRLDSRICRSALFESSFIQRSGNEIILAAREAEAGIISPHVNAVTSAFVEQCHSAGFRVLVWTVNEEVDMLRLFAWGVDGIISDYPDRLARAYSQRKTDFIETSL